MKPFTATVITVACLMSANAVFAQVPGAIQQVDSTQQRRANEQAATSLKEGDSVPTIYAGEESDVGPQSVLRLKPRKSYIEAMADVQYFHTDNMFLGEDFEQSADVLVSTAQIALAPNPYDLADGKFAPRIGYRHQWFNFGVLDSDKITIFDQNQFTTETGRLREFDFNAQTAFTELRWSRDNWVAGVGYDFTRLLSTSNYDDFYQEHVVRWGLQRLFPVADDMAFAIGYAGDFRFTSVDTHLPAQLDDYHDRTDHSLYGTFTKSLFDKMFIQPYYRFTYTHYTEVNRDDCLHSLGCGIYYYFTPQISARIFAAYDIRRSDGRSTERGQDYEKLDAGGGLNLTFRF